MRRLAVVLTLLALAAGCSRRDRNNPLDPANPQTGGRPTGFNAVAGFDIVSLSWTPQPSLDIDGFQIDRLLPGDSLYRPLGGLLSRDASSILDTEPNGATVRYRLWYVIQGQRSHLPAEDEATPGPLRPWVAEFGNSSLTRLSPDGRDVVFRTSGVGAVQSLDVDRANGRVWCSSSQDGWLTNVDPDGSIRVQVTGLQQPYTLAISPGDGSVWACDLYGQVLHYALDGSPATPGAIGNLAEPEGVAVNPGDYSVWVCERQGNRVRHYSAAGQIINSTTLGLPTRVAVDSATGIAWVTSYDRGRLWRLAPDGRLIDSTSVIALGLALDRPRGRVWLADPFDGAAIALDFSTLAPLVTVAVQDVRDVAVDRATGDAWFTSPGLGAVVRLRSDGHELQRLTGLSVPTEIRLDPGLP